MTVIEIQHNTPMTSEGRMSSFQDVSVNSRLKRCIGRTREPSMTSIIPPPVLPMPHSDNHLGDALSS